MVNYEIINREKFLSFESTNRKKDITDIDYNIIKVISECKKYICSSLSIFDESQTESIMIYHKLIKICIHYYEDEWFIVKSNSFIDRWYKCDRVDGLIQCLNDNFQYN